MEPQKPFRIRNIIRAMGFLALVTSYFIHGEPEGAKWAMAVVAGTMAAWWIFEVAPLGITALLPLVAYPFLGITSTKNVAPYYMNSTLFIFIGGFFVALAMQRCNLHRRIALAIICFFGNSPSRIIIGFMSATWFLSMWISNTATAVMMVSVGLALIQNLDGISMSQKNKNNFATCLMLSIAYSASVGGMATLIGTPPNLAFSSIYAISFPEAGSFSLGDWLPIGFPCSVFIFFIVFSVLYIKFLRVAKETGISLETVKNELKAMGKPTKDEKLVGFVFAMMAFLWIFRSPIDIPFLNISIPSWMSLLHERTRQFTDDGTIAVLCSLILFFAPSMNERKKLLMKSDISNIPWETILLFGGGFALAKGMGESGLSNFLVDQFKALGELSLFTTMITLTGGMSFLTELTSNTASTQLVLPILVAMSESLNVNALYFMIPTTLAASCAFMLPAATAPNAIIFSSKKVTIVQMIKTGFIINILSILAVSLWCYTIIPTL